MKKLISLLLCAALVISLIPIGVLSASAKAYTVIYYYNCPLPGDVYDHVEYSTTDSNGYVDPYPANLPDRDDENIFFYGWYIDSYLTVPFDSSKPVTGTTALYGRWVDYDDTVSVYIYLSTTATIPTAGVDVPIGDVYGEPAAPGRDDATFGGWYTDRDLTEPYDPTQPITEDTSLFPKWIVGKPQITSVANAYGGVKITVKAIDLAPKYRYFRKEAGTGWKKIADSAATSIVDKTAVSGTKYWYTVRVVSVNGKTYQSGYDTAGKAITYVAAPVITQFQNVNTGTKFTWSASKGASCYRVFQKSGSTWKVLGDTTATSFTATGRTGGTKYIYTVRAMNASKQYVSAYNSTGWSYTFIAPPALPTLTNTRSGVQITYTKSAGGVYFRIFRKTGTGGWAKLADTSAVKFLDTTAKNGVRYTYTIRCISKDGTKYYSGYNATGKSIVCRR